MDVEHGLGRVPCTGPNAGMGLLFRLAVMGPRLGTAPSPRDCSWCSGSRESPSTLPPWTPRGGPTSVPLNIPVLMCACMHALTHMSPSALEFVWDKSNSPPSRCLRFCFCPLPRFSSLDTRSLLQTDRDRSEALPRWTAPVPVVWHRSTHRHQQDRGVPGSRAVPSQVQGHWGRGDRAGRLWRIKAVGSSRTESA